MPLIGPDSVRRRLLRPPVFLFQPLPLAIAGLPAGELLVTPACAARHATSSRIRTTSSGMSSMTSWPAGVW